MAISIAALLSAVTGVAAQNGSQAPAAHRSERGRAVLSMPAVIPEQFAPPQESYASFPDSGGASPTPAPPSTCQVRLAKIAVFQFGPPLRVLDNFDSYECRGRNRVRAAALSEHGRADALDIRAFKLADGRELGLTDVKVERDWREKIRSTACARFSTVLGPGSDGYHEEHIHVDLADRRNGYKLCQWDIRDPPVAQAQGQPPASDNAGEQAGEILPEDVPLPRPRPRTANLTSNRLKNNPAP